MAREQVLLRRTLQFPAVAADSHSVSESNLPLYCFHVATEYGHTPCVTVKEGTAWVAREALP